MDFVIANNNGPARLYLNQVHNGNHWLSVKLETSHGNRFGEGSTDAVAQAGPVLYRHAHRDGSYLSAGDIRVHFGLGATAAFDGVQVVWPDGSKKIFCELFRRSRGHAEAGPRIEELSRCLASSASQSLLVPPFPEALALWVARGAPPDPRRGAILRHNSQPLLTTRHRCEELVGRIYYFSIRTARGH